MSSTNVLEEVLNRLDRDGLDAFKIIAKQRYLKMKDFSEAPESENVRDINILKKALNQLKDIDLIKEQAAPIDMFNIYSITAKGLYVNRLLHRNR